MAYKKKSITKIQWLQLLIHASSVLPLLMIGLDALRNTLGFNPVQTILHSTGRAAVITLLLSLSCTPLHNVFRLPQVRHMRKPLGLYAAFYATVHFAIFAIWDYQLNFNLIWSEIRSKPFILLGVTATFILIILAATSFRFWQQKLGKWWFRLHKLVYAVGVLMIIHYLLAVKGDLFSLQGAYRSPLIAGGILLLLFILRIPDLYQPLRRFFKRE